ncbi:MAG: hypothetical protein RR643_04885 [Anaerorhabdus sp.]|uniref:hypothetical protein n=1 Tax=Anaerorhabdus sp. TaxID=1872524 RepID=UPI002FC5F29F
MSDISYERNPIKVEVVQIKDMGDGHWRFSSDPDWLIAAFKTNVLYNKDGLVYFRRPLTRDVRVFKDSQYLVRWGKGKFSIYSEANFVKNFTKTGGNK